MKSPKNWGFYVFSPLLQAKIFIKLKHGIHSQRRNPDLFSTRASVV